jgi:hypothetical protein
LEVKLTEKTANHRQNRESEVRQTQDRKITDPSTSGFQVNDLDLQLALNDSANASPGAILQLQRIAGNRAVSRLIQAKLTVGAADDPYEQEADRIASTVVSMAEPGQQTNQAKGGNSLQREGSEEEEEVLQGKPLAANISRFVQREASPEEEEIQMKPAVQREASPEEEEIQMKPEVQREASPEEEEIQMKPEVQREASPEEEEIQMKSTVQREASPEEEEVL